MSALCSSTARGKSWSHSLYMWSVRWSLCSRWRSSLFALYESTRVVRSRLSVALRPGKGEIILPIPSMMQFHQFPMIRAC